MKLKLTPRMRETLDVLATTDHPAIVSDRTEYSTDTALVLVHYRTAEALQYRGLVTITRSEITISAYGRIIQGEVGR